MKRDDDKRISQGYGNDIRTNVNSIMSSAGEKFHQSRSVISDPYVYFLFTTIDIMFRLQMSPKVVRSAKHVLTTWTPRYILLIRRHIAKPAHVGIRTTQRVSTFCIRVTRNSIDIQRSWRF